MILPRLIIVWINGPLLAGTEEQENVHFTLFERTDSFIAVWSERGNLIPGGCIVSLSPVIFLNVKKGENSIVNHFDIISCLAPSVSFLLKKLQGSQVCNYFRLRPRCIADNICCRDDVDASAHYFLLHELPSRCNHFRGFCAVCGAFERHTWHYRLIICHFLVTGV